MLNIHCKHSYGPDQSVNSADKINLPLWMFLMANEGAKSEWELLYGWHVSRYITGLQTIIIIWPSRDHLVAITCLIFASEHPLSQYYHQNIFNRMHFWFSLSLKTNLQFLRTHTYSVSFYKRTISLIDS